MSKVAFQGVLGAYSHRACQSVFPDMDVLPCESFEDAFAAVEEGQATYTIIPIENSTAGRVADIHHIMPQTTLSIIGEYFLPVHHCLLGTADSQMNDVKEVMSHVQALGQCAKNLKKHALQAVAWPDTAGAAAEIANRADKHTAALASEAAADIYNLKVLQHNFQDRSDNTTRFLIISSPQNKIEATSDMKITTFIFKVRNIPAALYKALGGFATNGVNILKLESYMVEGGFQSAQFYVDIQGDSEDKGVQLAMEELRFFSDEIKMLGSYPAHSYRKEVK